jgi:uncharacterized protein
MAEAMSTRSRVRRHSERGRYDRSTVDAILDEGLVCHLGVIVDGAPRVLPTLYARDGDVLYLHGAPANAMLNGGKESPVCLTVSLIDGLVLARSVNNHSVNYRSVVVYGRPTVVSDPEEKMRALRVVVEHVCPGRWDDAREPSAAELASTLVLRLGLDEVSAKVREGGPADKPEDVDLPVWAGVLPFHTTAGTPQPAPGVPDEIGVPAYLSAYARPGSVR